MCTLLVFLLIVFVPGGAELQRDEGSKKARQYLSPSLTAEISVGTPPQTFTVAIDPFSSDFYLVDVNAKIPAADTKCPSYCRDKVFCGFICQASCCKNNKEQRSTFDKTKSSTFQTVDAGFKIVGISGSRGTDTLQVGDVDELSIRIPNTLFGQATNVAKYALSDDVDGVIGFSTSVGGDEGFSSFLLNAVEQNAIERPLYTIWFSRDDGDIGGIITYGDVDTKNCDGEVNWISTFDGGMINISSVRIATSYSFDAYPGMITFASSTDYPLGAPNFEADRIARAYGATPFDGLYMLPCNASGAPLTFTIAGAHGAGNYEIPLKELLYANGRTDGMCWLNIMAADSWFLNAALVRYYCLSVDFGNSMIGLATSLRK